MSRTSAIFKNQFEKHIKHQRQEYFIMCGNIIEVGWKGILSDFIEWIRGNR